MPSAVAHGPPEVVLGDHAEREPAAVGAAEHAVAGRAARRLGRGPGSRCPTAARSTTRPRRPSPRRCARLRPVRSLFAHAAQIASAATVAAARSAIGTRGIAGIVGRVRARDRARERLVVHVVTGQRGERTGLAVAAHRAVDDRRVDGLHVLVADAETVGDAGPPPLAEHVGARRELERARPSRVACAGRARRCPCATRRRGRCRETCASGRAPGGSSFSTSAPRSASSCVACGTGRQMPASSTRMPSSRPAVTGSPRRRGAARARRRRNPASSRSTASVLVPSSSAGGRSTRPANEIGSAAPR